MIKNYPVVFFLFLSLIVVAQNKEKIKGSKIVTIEQKEISDFDSVEVSDNIEVFLERGVKCALKIEADDNLQEVISVSKNANTLEISTTKKVTSFKNLVVRITYNQKLNLIVAKDESKVNSIQEIQLDTIMVRAQNNAVLNLNVNTTHFTIQTDDKSKTELNLKSENAVIQSSKYSKIKAIISTTSLVCDLYQKSEATLQGEVNNALIRLDNNSTLIAKNFIIKTATLIKEKYTNCSINVSSKLSLDASGNSKVKLYGDQKIEMNKFTNSASLEKKSSQ